MALLAREALSDGDDVTLLTRSEARSAPQWDFLRTALKEGLKVVDESDFSSANIGAIADRLGCDVVTVPDADRFVLTLFGPRRWRGRALLVCLIMRSVSQPRRSQLLTRSITMIRRSIFWAAGRAGRVRVVFLRSALVPPDDERGRWAVDPIEFVATRQHAARYREAVGIGPAKRVFAVVGALDERKNVPLIVEALAGANLPDLVLLLAGRIADSARSSIDASVRSGRAEGLEIVVDDRVLPDADLDSAVLAADCLVLAYSNEGPSGILGKAMVAGIPVIAAGAQSLRRDSQLRPTLMKWVPLTATALRESIVVSKVFLNADRPRSDSAVLRAVDGFVDPLLRRSEGN
ncbi:glycosyltransferase [Curtobacterium sp. RRHDQ10]|uniref:glycosyltransferase n=1 Tax=Curtobacterium phyllosphaerae TaxID=3413379 RepID=UPI003BF1CBC7